MKQTLPAALAALTVLSLVSSPARAEIETHREFALIPMLETGRVMPIDTFARSTLLTLNGRSRFQKLPASHWLARVLFTPDQTWDDKVFLINNPEVSEALGLPPAKGRERYSYRDLEPVIETLRPLVSAAWNLDKNARSPVDQELLRLYHGLGQYRTLTGSLAFTVPHPDFTVTDPALKTDLDLPGDQDTFSYFQIMERSERLQPLFSKAADQAASQGEATQSLYHAQVVNLVKSLSSWRRGGDNELLKIIPVSNHGDDSWVTPWHAMNMRPGSGPPQAQLRALGDMAEAFGSGKQVAFDIAARSFHANVATTVADPSTLKNLKLEVLYNRSKAFYRAELLYGFGFLLALISIMVPSSRWLYRGGILLTVLALAPHTLGIIARMQIMARPPVTNLYSTFVFVAWCSALLGLVLEYLQRNRIGLLTASVCGLALLLTSGRFAVEGDTMGVMVAVLDSNFWLATHVVTITVGYAGCCVAGLIGHIYLLQAIRHSTDHPQVKETYHAMYGALAFGLIFSFLGTMLGGVWADQSWGRFWGWDPKENGALIIVLWSALLFHAKMGRMVGPAGFAAGCVLGVIWVLLAWLGVNLLGVGLHSYGFTSGIARGLLIACLVEILFVTATLPFARRTRPPTQPAAA